MPACGNSNRGKSQIKGLLLHPTDTLTLLHQLQHPRPSMPEQLVKDRLLHWLQDFPHDPHLGILKKMVKMVDV